MNNNILANEDIYGGVIIFVDENGINKGELNKRLAISQAKEKGLDLVQVAKHNNGIPICKFADASKMKFEASKKRHESKPIETKGFLRVVRVKNPSLGLLHFFLIISDEI